LESLSLFFVLVPKEASGAEENNLFQDIRGGSTLWIFEYLDLQSIHFYIFVILNLVVIPGLSSGESGHAAWKNSWRLSQQFCIEGWAQLRGTLKLGRTVSRALPA
jgi:hypothetical protein